jgi:uncharacterized protein (DUF983 family)
VTSVWTAIRHQFCPRCRTGPLFRTSLWRGFLNMYERCPHCGHKYEREPGYFLGALYFSYALSIPPGLLMVLLIWHFSGWPFDWSVGAAFLAYLPLVPLVTRWARVFWMHLDWHFDPDKS